MKFALVVLLGLCAFTSATSELDLFQDIPEVHLIKYEDFPPGFNLPEYVNSFIKKSVDEFNGLLQKFKDLSQTNIDKMNKLAEDVQARIQTTVNEAAEKIKDLKNKGGKMATCAVQHNEELLDITKSVTLGIKECAQDIIAAIKELGIEVSGSSAKLVASITKLTELATKCYSEETTVAQAKCIFSHFTEFKNLIMSLINDTKEAITILKDKGQILIDAAKSCNENHVQTNLAKGKDLKAKLDECYKN